MHHLLIKCTRLISQNFIGISRPIQDKRFEIQFTMQLLLILSMINCYVRIYIAIHTGVHA